MPRPGPAPTPASPPTPPEMVDPRWLLRAAGAVVALGLLLAYITLCWFFYLGQWELVLHPSATVALTPSSKGLAFTPVRFGEGAAGKPELSGWWIPAGSPANPSVLMLHGQTGSMSDALSAAKALHDAGLNVLLFDFRGYGQSDGPHPTEASMQADAAAALAYLTSSTQSHPGALLVYGAGLGASLAVRLCAQDPGIAGLILESADGDTLTRVEADQRSHILPTTLLFHERFPLARPLQSLSTPKLLLSHTRDQAPVIAQRAASPKMTVEVGEDPTGSLITAAVRRFLDTYLSQPAPLQAGSRQP